MKATLCGLLLVLAAAPAQAWLDSGHVVVAQIAHDRLTPEVKSEADRLIGLLADFEPVRADFVSASAWLDDIKTAGWYTFNRWHYIDLPYNAEGLAELPGADTDNAVWAVEDALRILGDEKTPDLAKAFSLRVLIHIVADMHQPLHCVTRFSQALPDGDRGAGLFQLDEGNLHFFWDQAAGLFGAPGELGASSPSADIAEAVAELLAAVPEEALPDWRELDPMVWARESYRLATSVAYVGLLEGRAPSEGYRIRAQLVSQRRLVVAGYRLAALLEQALTSPPSPAAPSDSE